MWSAQIEAGKGEARRQEVLAGYAEVSELMAALGRRLAAWPYLTEARVYLYWDLPQAGRQECR